GGRQSSPKQPFERMLGAGPRPPAGRSAMAVDVGSGEGASPLHLGQHLVDEVALFCPERREPPIDAAALAGFGHAPAQQWLYLDRKERGLVRPIFEAEAWRTRQGPVKEFCWVGAGSRE